MAIDFSSALRQEQEQKFKSDLFAAIKQIQTELAELKVAIAALKPVKAPKE